MACASTAGFHQCAFNSCAKGLSRNKKRAIRVLLELADRLLPVIGLPIEIRVADSALIKRFAHDCQQARELRKHERLAAALADLLQLREQHVELGAWPFVVALADEARMARGLAKTQQGLQNLDFRLGDSFVLHQLEQPCAIVVAQFVNALSTLAPVNLALNRLKLAIESMLALFRQFRDNSLFRAAQDPCEALGHPRGPVR